MARTSKKTEVITRTSPEAFNSYDEVVTRLAAVAVPNNTKGSAREKIMMTRVQMHKAFKNGYSKAQIAAAFKTSKQTVSQYINAVDMALKTADMVRNPRS